MILLGSGCAITISTLTLINPSVCIVMSISTALLTSIAILFTNENISSLKLKYTKLQDWINANTLLKEKTLKQSMIVEKIDNIDSNELKKIYDHSLDR